jgi:pimeloyl-ACP methyl ester carboxylesterase
MRWVFALVTEFLSFLLLLFLYLNSCFSSKIVKNLFSRFFKYNQKNQLLSPAGFSSQWTEKQKIPILLVHGYLNAGFVWQFQKKRLERDFGHLPIYLIDLGHPFQSIHDYALKIRDRAAAITRETGADRLTLVGHSMGGLVCYYYAVHLAPPLSVQKVISIASPLQGTYAAWLGVGQSAHDMRTGSPLLRNLAFAAANRRDIEFYNIATKTDELIIPYTSSFLHTEPSHRLCLDGIGHASLLFSRRVSRQLGQWIYDFQLPPVTVHPERQLKKGR